MNIRASMLTKVGNLQLTRPSLRPNNNAELPISRWLSFAISTNHVTKLEINLP